MNGQLRIDSMFAFVVVDEDGTEGIPAFQVGGLAMPMVGADTARIEQLRLIAKSMATELGKPIELVRYSVREHIEVIDP